MKYAGVGVFNPLIYWLAFCVLIKNDFSTGIGNLLGFWIAASVSYATNSLFTFKVETTGSKYWTFIVLIGALRYLIGMISDILRIEQLFAPVVFSFASLTLDYLLSSKFVFKAKK